jgi:uncharacterized small protein (DUF1192 family)
LVKHAWGFIDSGPFRVNFQDMDTEEFLPKGADDPIVALARQDLDPLSVGELETRVSALEAEIARIKEKIRTAVNHRASADALFKR